MLQATRDYSAPGALDAVNREAARFSLFTGTKQSVDEYSVKFDLLRRRAAARMQPGGPLLAVFESVTCLRNAARMKPAGSGKRTREFGDCRNRAVHALIFRTDG